MPVGWVEADVVRPPAFDDVRLFDLDDRAGQDVDDAQLRPPPNADHVAIGNSTDLADSRQARAPAVSGERHRLFLTGAVVRLRAGPPVGDHQPGCRLADRRPAVWYRSRRQTLPLPRHELELALRHSSPDARGRHGGLAALEAAKIEHRPHRS